MGDILLVSLGSAQGPEIKRPQPQILSQFPPFYPVFDGTIVILTAAEGTKQIPQVMS